MVIKTRGKKKNKKTIFILLVLLAIIIIIAKPLLKKKPEKPVRKPPAERITPYAGKKPTPPPEKEKPLESYIAVIIDDVGYPVNTIERFASFRGKITFSVLPFLTHSREYADLFHRKGFEIMLHIPMEPLSYPVDDPGFGAIFTGDTKAAVEVKIQRMLDNVPHARGANNHMGSRATKDFQLMTWALSSLRERNMFFIDSLTTPASRAYDAARMLGIDTAKRYIFLDNQDDYSSINTQFEKLKHVAVERGVAIGIGHIQSAHLIDVLNAQLPLLEKEHIALIFASEAVRKN